MSGMADSKDHTSNEALLPEDNMSEITYSKDNTESIKALLPEQNKYETMHSKDNPGADESLIEKMSFNKTKETCKSLFDKVKKYGEGLSLPPGWFEMPDPFPDEPPTELTPRRLMEGCLETLAKRSETTTKLLDEVQNAQLLHGITEADSASLEGFEKSLSQSVADDSQYGEMLILSVMQTQDVELPLDSLAEKQGVLIELPFGPASWGSPEEAAFDDPHWASRTKTISRKSNDTTPTA